MADYVIRVVSQTVSVAPAGFDFFQPEFARLDAKVRLDDESVAIGLEALNAEDPGLNNIAIGDEALENNEANNNVAVGKAAARANLGGTENVTVGTGASVSRLGGEKNVVIGESADSGHSGSGDRIVVIGQGSAPTGTGDDYVAVGQGSLANLTTGVENTAVGGTSGTGVVDGDGNVAVGFQSGVQVGSGGIDDTVAIGRGVQTTRAAEVKIGVATMDRFTAGPTVLLRRRYPGFADADSIFFGGAGNDTSTGPANLGIGGGAMAGVGSGAHALGIGLYALQNMTDATGSVVAIGSYACRQFGSTGSAIDTVAIGFNALAAATEGVGGVLIGHFAGENLLEAGANTGIGDSALRETTTGELNVAVGYTTMDKNETGSRNVAVGVVANFTRTDGEGNAFFGHGAGRYGASGGDYMVGVGFEALAYATGDNNVAVGYRAGFSITTAADNTFIGPDAGNNGSQKVDVVNSIALGHDAFTTKDNQQVLGGPNITETLIQGKVGIGVNTAPTANLQTRGTSNTEIPLFERDYAGSPSDNALAAFNVRSRRTGTMGDGFGSGIRFLGIDDAATERPLGLFTAVRRGADNIGEILVRPQNGSSFAQGLAVRGEMASLMRQTAPVSGGDANSAFTLTSSLIGVYAGTGAPTIAAAKGSLYMRADGSTTNDRMYVNTDGGTTWTHLVTGA